jgi:hypothetical protein
MAKTKKDVQTPHHYLLAFLQSVSGISGPMALAIAGEVASLEDFIQLCRKKEEEEREEKKDDKDAPKKKIIRKKKGIPITGAEAWLAEIPIPVTDGIKTRKLGVERGRKILSSLGIERPHAVDSSL